MPRELDARNLLVRVAQRVAVGVVVVIAISAVPGLDEIRARLEDADPVWVAGALLVGLSPTALRALGDRDARVEGDGRRHRAARVVRAWLEVCADGVDQAISLLRSRSVGVVIGSLAYLWFDIAALGCGFAAVGTVPPWGALVLGYLIGQLGDLIPVPGGIGGTEGALVAVFALYGVHVTDATAAVLLYRLFQLTVPALLGMPAFVMLRRKLLQADRPALVCAPLALQDVHLAAQIVGSGPKISRSR